MRILIVEDEEDLANALKKGLEKFGYAVDYLLDGEAGERRITLRHNDYDFIVLDLMLPRKSGLEVCRSLRSIGITTPILILTGRDNIHDKVSALDSGADDYLVKPFSFEELLARIRAIYRRPPEAFVDEIRIYDIVLNPATREVRRGEEKINLTLKEFEILHYLMRNPNKAIDREELFVHLWDFADNSLSNVIDVHIKNLRNKIDKDNDEKILETVRGVGYRIRK